MVHTECGTKARGIGCGIGTFLQIHSSIVRSIEDREDAQQVGCIINGHALYGQEVVGVVATLYVQASVQLGIGLHAWQHLGATNGVGITQHLGQHIKGLGIPPEASV